MDRLEKSRRADHDALAEAFHDAAARCPEALVERRIVLAGRPALVRIVGIGLAEQVALPFAHLRVPSEAVIAGPPQLTLELWDETEAGVPCPVNDATAGSPSVSAPDRAHLYHRDSASLTALDRPAGHAVGWRAAAGRVEICDRAKPLPVILPVWCLDHGVNIVHCAMVARGSRGALIAGPAGAGKSTWSLACAGDGLAFLGDDQVGLEETESGAFIAHSLYATARLDSGDLERHPRLGCGAPVVTEAGEKVLLHLGAGRSARLATEARVEVILLPRRDDSLPRLEPAEPAQALLELAPTSLLGVLGGGAWGFERLGRLVERVPAFWACSGPDLDSLPALVDRALVWKG